MASQSCELVQKLGYRVFETTKSRKPSLSFVNLFPVSSIIFYLFSLLDLSPFRPFFLKH